MAAFAAIWIPLGWIYHIIRYGRDWETFRLCFKPMGLKEHKLRPQDKGEKSLDSLFPQSPEKDLPYREDGEPYHLSEQMEATNVPNERPPTYQRKPHNYDEINESAIASLNARNLEGQDNPAFQHTFTKL